MLNRPSAIREIMRMTDEKNVRRMGLDPTDIISFGGGWVGHKAPERLREIYQDICADPQIFHEAGAYPPTPGLRACREQLARLDDELFGVEVREENVLISQSSTQLTHDVFRAIANPGDCVVLLDPTYANYYGQLVFSLPHYNGGVKPEAKVAYLKTFDAETWSFMPDVDASIGELEDIFRKEKPNSMLIPSPDNPTGQVVSDKFVKAAMELCQENDAYLLLDNAYKTQCFLETMPDYYSWSPDEFENLILIYSNSKWARGLGRRMGWIIASDMVVNGLTQMLNYSLLCADNLHQLAMAGFLEQTLDDGSLKNYLDDTRNAYKRAAKVTVDAIDEYCGTRRLLPQGGIYTLAEFGDGSDSFVTELMKNTGVLFVPGIGFGESARPGVRVSYGPLVEDMDKIVEGMKRVGEYLHEN
ncbi:MAG: pyridoxal phosphate-dependent aminotransferase [Methanomassiliicoccales archaeon]|nr:pyridoxal phosphate-dependent aminotransferase [Methanomassiliicoccales archaeon]NYT14687.1 pyridoxal phosphate-dependent aminotransferase [Methanomassiliicoccales archaeon]